MAVQGIWSGTESDDGIVRTYAKFEKAEAEWREAIDCALSSCAPASMEQIRSVAVATTRLLEARARWQMYEETAFWARKLGV